MQHMLKLRMHVISVSSWPLPVMPLVNEENILPRVLLREALIVKYWADTDTNVLWLLSILLLL